MIPVDHKISRTKSNGHFPREEHWVGQKVNSEFSTGWHGNIRMNFLANPVVYQIGALFGRNGEL